MGARSIDELIGRSDLLAARSGRRPGRACSILSEIMAEPAAADVRKKSIDIDHHKPPRSTTVCSN